MSGTETTGPRPGSRNGDHGGAGGVPGVADLGSFRGRTERTGVPILPPGWRPDREPMVMASVDAADTVPVSRPVPAPPGGRVVVGATGGGARHAGPERQPSTPPLTERGTDVRTLRRIRPWSVWKMALAFMVCIVAVVATAGAILWAAAAALGVLDNVEGFVEDLGFDNFAFNGGAMLRAFIIGGLLASLLASIMATVLAIMFNLLSELTGGIEAETSPPKARRRDRRRARRQARRRGGQPVIETTIESIPAPAAEERPPPESQTVPVAGVEVGGTRRRVDLDLTDDPDMVESSGDVDHIQLAIDDLLRDEPPT